MPLGEISDGHPLKTSAQQEMGYHDSRIWEDLMLRYRNPAFAGNYGEEREEREEFRERAFEGSLLNGLRLPGLLLTLQVAMKTHQSRIRYV